MSGLLLALLAQAGELRLQDLGREVIVRAPLVRSTDAPAVLLRRRVTTLKGGRTGERRLGETWRDESQALAAGSKDRWRAEVRLPQPGSYELRIGETPARLVVSRSGFEGWERPLGDLRAAADRLATLARRIDAGEAAEPLARELASEGAKLLKLRTEFDASWEAVRDGIDRLRFHRSLLLALGAKAGADAEYGKDPGAREREGPPKALEAVEGIAPFVARELSLKLVDEVLLVLEDAAPHRIVRWPGRLEAVGAAARACGKLGALPEAAGLFASAPPEESSADWDAFRESARLLRARLVE